MFNIFKITSLKLSVQLIVYTSPRLVKMSQKPQQDCINQGITYKCKSHRHNANSD